MQSFNVSFGVEEYAFVLLQFHNSQRFLSYTSLLAKCSNNALPAVYTHCRIAIEVLGIFGFIFLLVMSAARVIELSPKTLLSRKT